MRTTIALDDDLLRRLKHEAAEQGRTLAAVVNDLLRRALAPPPRGKPYRFDWKTERGRLQPGVRLDDRESLFDVMEGR